MQISNLNRSFWSREYIAIDQSEDESTLNLHVRTLNIFQQALRRLFGFYSNTIWSYQKTYYVGRLANVKEWEKVETAITDPDLFEKVFKVAKKVIIQKDENSRNILALGKPGSGKTTMITTLNNVCHVADGVDNYNKTKVPTAVILNLGNYKFNFLDTPGLTKETIELIQKGVRNIFGGKDFSHVDTVIYTLAFTQGLNAPDIECLKTVLPMFPKGARKIIVVTHEESGAAGRLENVIKILQDNQDMKQSMQEHFGNGANVLLSGCLDQFAIDNRNKKIRLNTVWRQSRELMAALLPDSLSNAQKVEIIAERSRTVKPIVEAFLTEENAMEHVLY